MKYKIYRQSLKVLPVLLLIATTLTNSIKGQNIINGSFTGTPDPFNGTPSGWTKTNGYYPSSTFGVDPTISTFDKTSFYTWHPNYSSISPSPDGGTWLGLTQVGGENEAIEQTVNGFTIGKSYTISFYYAHFGWIDGTINGPGNVVVYANGTPIATAPTVNYFKTWTKYTGTFVASATTLTFQIDISKPGVGGGACLSIDGFSLNACATVAPTLSTNSIGNICPDATVNLNNLETSIGPSGNSLVWFTNNAHSGAAYPTPSAATAGTYYAFYYNSALNCYSPASSSVTVTIASCLSYFGCNNNMYLSQGNQLYTIGTSTNPFTYPLVGTSSLNYNAIGLNPVDGKMYGMQANSNTLININTDGTTTSLGTVTGLPTTTPATTYFAGEIDTAGNYYILPNTTGGSNRFYKVNLTTKAATLITLSRVVYIPDIAYSITTGLLYGVDNSATNGQLVTINPSTGIVTNIGTPQGNANFGAMYSSSTGEIFGVSNSGGFYQFNLTTGERVLISGAPVSSSNDGAHCVTQPIKFSADLNVTKIDGTTTYTPGSTTNYTITVSNSGPFGVLNATVTDAVPPGISAANVSYTAVASIGSTTTVSGTQTGSINDLVGLPVGGTVTYYVAISIPIGFDGPLVNTVTVTPPSNITDTNTANNSATDTDYSSACYKPGVAGTGLPTNHGISALGRAGKDNDNWPMVRESAWTVLEAKTKGFVVNRISTTAALQAIPDPVEGMMVYDVEAACLKIYSYKSGSGWGWFCFTTPSCAE